VSTVELSGQMEVRIGMRCIRLSWALVHGQQAEHAPPGVIVAFTKPRLTLAPTARL
jgi:hypothetical protein